MKSLICPFLLLISFAAFASAQNFRVLHTFGELPDGQKPGAALVPDAAGNLYSTTALGGKAGEGRYSELCLRAKRKSFMNSVRRRMGLNLRRDWCGTAQEISTGLPQVAAFIVTARSLSWILREVGSFGQGNVASQL
jgi:hypothetical protein